MKNYKLSVIFVTLYLFVFTVLSRMDIELEIMLSLFSLSPFLILWMVYSVLKYGKHSGKALNEREWGYEDRV
ncbi:MAG: hypothetical protein J7604_24495 [Sporocytophaga sp.]|uniref:hypothetical protein n=1 Tax=Sporocytophaga sp. TaxID=2231183 RepID=UPI001B0E9408|nr:hypothetical protein [Sporocytophaga sp.]MBO9703391.1 hypothetical protein [Sporocytophaga sp.]